MSSDEKQESIEEVDDGDDELSLDRLSEAYAEVLRQQTGKDDDSEPEGPVRGELVADKLARDAEESEDEDSDDDDAEQDFDELPDDDTACPITPESIVESILFVGVPRGCLLYTSPSPRD